MSNKRQLSTHSRTKARRIPNEQLKAHRLKKNWTQVYVATRIGTSDVEVSRWETGATIPTLYFREQLCTLFGTTPEELGFVCSPVSDLQPPQTVIKNYWNVPRHRTPYFTGREEILTCLYDALHSARTPLAQVQAISGLAGIGKTQVAIEYTCRHRDEYQAVFWIKADTPENLLADIGSLAALLNLAEKDERNQRRMVEVVKRWLTTHSEWLLILDNVEELEQVEEWLTLETGQVLLTTRNQVTGTLAQCMNLTTMGSEEGSLFLLRRAKYLAPHASLEEATLTDRTLALEIVKVLDGLPLALDQAGAYIEETACGLRDYLEHYQCRRAALLNRRGIMPTTHAESVSTTLALCIEKVQQRHPSAGELLDLCAFLAPDDIPEELLTNGASVLDPALQTLAENPLSLDAAIAELRHYSLLQRNAAHKSLTIHRLVQAVLRDGMCAEEQHRWAEQVVRMVSVALPFVDDVTEGTKWEQGKRYHPQIYHCMSLIKAWHIHSPEVEEILDWAGSYLRVLGQYTHAETLLQTAIQLGQTQRGAEDLSVARHMNCLALVYGHQGRYAQAASLFEQALRIRRAILEPEHPSIAECLNNLGWLTICQGHYMQAEPLLLEATAIWEKIQGPERSELAFSLTNLGWLYYHLGDYTQAEMLNQRALHMREQALGENHVLVASNLENLGMIYREQGDLSRAEPILQQALHIRQEALGRDHPDVAQSLYQLAQLFVLLERKDRAVSLFQCALAISEQLPGREHPLTQEMSRDYADLLNTMHRA